MAWSRRSVEQLASQHDVKGLLARLDGDAAGAYEAAAALVGLPPAGLDARKMRVVLGRKVQTASGNRLDSSDPVRQRLFWFVSHLGTLEAAEALLRWRRPTSDGADEAFDQAAVRLMASPDPRVRRTMCHAYGGQSRRTSFPGEDAAKAAEVLRHDLVGGDVTGRVLALHMLMGFANPPEEEMTRAAVMLSYERSEEISATVWPTNRRSISSTEIGRAALGWLTPRWQTPDDVPACLGAMLMDPDAAVAGAAARAISAPNPDGSGAVASPAAVRRFAAELFGVIERLASSSNPRQYNIAVSALGALSSCVPDDPPTATLAAMLRRGGEAQRAVVRALLLRDDAAAFAAVLDYYREALAPERSFIAGALSTTAAGRRLVGGQDTTRVAVGCSRCDRAALVLGLGPPLDEPGEPPLRPPEEASPGHEPPAPWAWGPLATPWSWPVNGSVEALRAGRIGDEVESLSERVPGAMDVLAAWCRQCQQAFCADHRDGEPLDEYESRWVRENWDEQGYEERSWFRSLRVTFACGHTYSGRATTVHRNERTACGDFARSSVDR